MKKAWSEIWNNQYTSIEWTCAKATLLLFWLVKITSINLQFQSAPFPTGIFSLISSGFMQHALWRLFVIALGFVLAIMYLFEQKMKFTTLALFFLSVFAFSLEESNGILNRFGLVSFVFFAQFLAYVLPKYLPKLNNTQLRFSFSIQAIAAAYMLSGISKLTTSGISWISDSKYLTLQILKSHYYKFVTSGDAKHLEIATVFTKFAHNNGQIVMLLLASSLVLELFAWISIGNKKRALVYGCLLIIMHWGIQWVMDIRLVAISRPMLIFMINPVFILWVIMFKPLSAYFSSTLKA